MKGNELVWRTIADAALRGHRRWKSVGDIADAAGVPATTGYLAIDKLLDIGAVEQRSPSGIATTNPEKVLTLLAAWRNLPRDTIARTTLAGIQPFMDSTRHPYAIGGADAAVTYLDEWNNVADIGLRLVYLPESVDVSDLPAGDEVAILRMDKRAQREWTDGYSSLAQTYADLFALPGWQAEEFRRALWERHFSAPDWDQKVHADDYSESWHRGGMKVRGKINGIHIDAYIPHESELGEKLRLKVDVLTKHTDPEPIQNWTLLNGEAHTITKMAALLDRPESEKGRKDAREVLAMLFRNSLYTLPPVDMAYAISILYDATAGQASDVPAHVERAFALLSELGEMNKKRRRELDALGKAWVSEAKDQFAARLRPNSNARFLVPESRADTNNRPRAEG